MFLTIIEISKLITFWGTLDEHLIVTAVLWFSVDRHGLSVSGEFKSELLLHQSSDLSIGGVASFSLVQSAHVSSEDVHLFDEDNEGGFGGFTDLFVNFLVDVVVDGGVVAHGADHGELGERRVVGAVDRSAVESDIASWFISRARNFELVHFARRGVGGVVHRKHLDAGHLVGGQSTGLVRANNGSAAKSFDGRKRSDN